MCRLCCNFCNKTQALYVSLDTAASMAIAQWM